MFQSSQQYSALFFLLKQERIVLGYLNFQKTVFGLLGVNEPHLTASLARILTLEAIFIQVSKHSSIDINVKFF
jgi:hypothetical protein